MRSFRVAVFLTLRSIVKGNIGITILAIMMLVLVAMNLLFVPGLIDGVVAASNGLLINTYSGDIIVEAQGDNPSISHVDDLISGIESINGVIAATARNDIGAAITFEDEKVNCVVVGVDPERDKAVFDVAKSMVEGSYLEPRDREQILLGVQIAGSDREDVELYSSSLRYVHAGDKVLVAYSNGVKKQYTVKGIFDTGFIQTDIQAFISQLEYRSIVPATYDKATSVRVKLERDVDPETVIRQISSLRGDLKFQKWHETAGIMESMTDSFKLIEQILNIVNLLIAGITVFIVTYVDVVNRRRQIGIQRAIGIKPAAITLSYLIRALLYTIMGLILGVLLFKYVIIPLEARHPFSFPFGAAYITIRPERVTRVAVILLVVSLGAAFMPVWRTMRIKILDAIWG